MRICVCAALCTALLCGSVSGAEVQQNRVEGIVASDATTNAVTSASPKINDTVGTAVNTKQQAPPVSNSTNDTTNALLHNKQQAPQLRYESDAFHITPAHLPDHVIGESGPLIMDMTERKTTKYSDVDAVNSAISAVAMSNVNQAMHRGKDWMRRTTVAISFQKDWKPVYSVESIQPIGHYDATSRHVWFGQGSVHRAADVGTTANGGIGYRRISGDERRLHGVHLFYDQRFKGHHGRMSAGYEYFSGESELRFQYYRGVSSESVVNGVNQRVTKGYTLQYGTTFENARWARVYGEAYRWTPRNSSDRYGFRIGTEMQLTPRISIDVGYNKPEHESGSGYGKIYFRLAGAPIAYWGGKHSLDTETTVRHKMLDKVQRHNTVYVE